MFRRYVPFIFSIIFFILCVYINSLVQVWTDRNSPYWLAALPDIGHQLLPYWTYFAVNNYYLLVSVFFVIFRYIFQSDIRLIVFRRWLFVQGLMFLMRSISIYVTSLSVPLPGCNTTALGSPPIEAFYIMVFIHSTCGDVLFSGHTVTRRIISYYDLLFFSPEDDLFAFFFQVTLCALAWTTYSRGEEHYPIRWLWSRCRGKTTVTTGQSFWLYPKLDSTGDPVSFYLTSLLVWLFTIIGYLFIIATRFHYTVDVFLGLLLSMLTWKYYHYYIKTLAERRNILLTRFFLWFEGYGNPSVDVQVSLLAGPNNKINGQFESSSHVIHPNHANDFII